MYQKCYQYSFHCSANKTIGLCPGNATNITDNTATGREKYEDGEDGDLGNNLFSCNANENFGVSVVVPVSKISSKGPGQQFVSCSANKNLVYLW